MEILNIHSLYIASATSLCTITYFILKTRLNKIKETRLNKLKRQKLYPVAVETETPQENPISEQRAIGEESIETRFNFISQFLPIVAVGFWLTLVITPYLNKVPAIYISIVIGSFSVLVGMAARPFIENLIAGLVLSMSQPVRIGDTVVIDEHYGVVEDIKLTHSILKVWDWRRLVIPNSQLLSKEIINHSLNDFHIWAWVEFYVSSDSDLDRVEEIAREIPQESPYFRNVESPAFWVMGMEKDSIKCWLAAWTQNPAGAWEMKNFIHKELCRKFREEEIHFHSFRVDTPLSFTKTGA